MQLSCFVLLWNKKDPPRGKCPEDESRPVERYLHRQLKPVVKRWSLLGCHWNAHLGGGSLNRRDSSRCPGERRAQPKACDQAGAPMGYRCPIRGTGAPTGYKQPESIGCTRLIQTHRMKVNKMLFG